MSDIIVPAGMPEKYSGRHFFMKRIRILFIAVMVLAFAVLTGCSSDDGNVSDNNNTPNSMVTSPAAAPTDDTSGGLLSTGSPDSQQTAPTGGSSLSQQ